MINNQIKKKVILIIEDNESLRQAVGDKLTRENFKILEARTGEKGLSLIISEKPDLVLLDLMLPKMQGEQVLKRMNEKKLIKKIPVIVLSVKGDDANINNCINNLGARDYLSKSEYTLKGIIAKINKFIK